VLDTALVSRQLLNTVADLQERYNLKQKDQQNKLLSLEIEHQKYQKRNMRLLTAGIALLAVLTLIILLLIKRKNGQLTRQNQIIQKQNSKLSKANSDKNSMISVVSHDLSAPFTSIKMWTQILQSDISNFTEDQKKALYRIQSSTDNGELLIRNILHIEKEEINRPLNLQFLDISAFLEDVINAHTPQAQQKDIQIVYRDDGKFTEFMCDRYMLNRICENLLSNAIKFSPRGSKVYVKLESTADNIVIKVIDEGVGIAPEDIPYIFSRYGKISSMPTEGEYSTGLGLSIVKRLVDELNGKIFCESVLNKGSVFTVVLPR
jgi:signal transduction histidine kinase